MHRCSIRAVAACEARWILSAPAPCRAELDTRRNPALASRLSRSAYLGATPATPVLELPDSEPVASTLIRPSRGATLRGLQAYRIEFSRLLVMRLRLLGNRESDV